MPVNAVRPQPLSGLGLALLFSGGGNGEAIRPPDSKFRLFANFIVHAASIIL